MVQAFLTNENRIRTKHYNKKYDATTLTGEGNVDIVYHLPKNKMLRLYYSNVYKEKVVSFNISAAKSFIIKKETWLQRCANRDYVIV